MLDELGAKSEIQTRAVSGVLVTHAVLEIDTEEGSALIGFPRGLRLRFSCDLSLPSFVGPNEVDELRLILEHMR